MKKFFFVIVTIFLVVVIAGCGTPAAQPDQTTPEQTDTPASQPDQTADQTDAAAVAAATALAAAQRGENPVVLSVGELSPTEDEQVFKSVVKALHDNGFEPSASRYVEAEGKYYFDIK